MPVPVVCPNCKKRFVVRPELAGRRVKCTGCKSAFEVPRPKDAPPPLDDLEIVEPAYDVAVAPAPAPRRSAATAPPPLPQSHPAQSPPPPSHPYAATRPPPRPAPMEWTPWQRLIFRTGWQVMLFGAASLVLPLFGLQFRKLQKAGVNSAAVGIGLIVAGALMCGGVLLRRAIGGAGVGRIPARAMLIAVAAIPLTCVAFMLISAWMLRPGQRVKGPTPGMTGPSGQPPAGPPGAPPGGFRTPPASPSGPGTGPGFYAGPGPGPGPAVGPGQRPPPAGGHNSMVAQYGAERVARIIVVGGPPPGTESRRGPSALETLLRHKIRPALAPGASQTSSSRARDGRVTMSVAPVDDLDALAKALDVGTVTSVDRETRTVTVKVDPAFLPAEPSAPAPPF